MQEVYRLDLSGSPACGVPAHERVLLAELSRCEAGQALAKAERRLSMAKVKLLERIFFNDAAT
jgi:hypothetical protein